MIEAVVYAICVLGWGMQLWFGVAVLGIPPNYELVFRGKSPLKYAIVMLFEFLIAAVIGWFRMKAGMR